MYNFDKIALIGKSGAGKTEVSKYLNEKYGYQICHTGRRVRELAREFFDDQSKDILHKIDDSFNSIEKGIWLKVALRSVDDLNNKIVIDSLRFFEDHVLAKSNGYCIWKIECEEKTRIHRLTKRNQIFNLGDLVHVSEVELDNIVPDFLIKNEHSNILELYSKIDAQLHRI